MANQLRSEFSDYPKLLWKWFTAKNTVKPQRVPFGSDRAQYFLHFASPKQRYDTVIVFLHGGGWNNGSPAMLPFIGQKFALEGYRCVMIGYRKTPKHRCETLTEDICNGYNAMRGYLADIGVDASKVVVAGASAGAHLGALLCYDTALQERFSIDPAQLCGFAGLAGPYDFSCAYPRLTQRLIADLFGPDTDWATGEPVRKLTAGQRVPMLLIHSPRDEVVSYQSAECFFTRARELGIPAELYAVPPSGGNHSSYSAGIFLDDRSDSQTLDALFDWIEQR